MWVRGGVNEEKRWEKGREGKGRGREGKGRGGEKKGLLIQKTKSAWPLLSQCMMYVMYKPIIKCQLFLQELHMICQLKTSEDHNIHIPRHFERTQLHIHVVY